MKTITVLIMLSVFCSEPGKLVDFKKVINKTNLTTKESFVKIMKENKHETHFLLPTELLDFIENHEPFRFSFLNSVSIIDGKLRLTWFFSEYAMEGKEADKRNEIQEYLSNKGMTETDVEGDFSFRYKKEGKTFINDFILLDLVNFQGGKRSNCGGTLVYSMETKASVKPVTINKALELLPSLKFESFPQDIYDFISELEFENIDYGGTWSRYYTWSVKIPYTNEDKLKLDLTTIQDYLVKDGFEKEKEKGGDITYRNSGKWFYIKSNKTEIELRYQPNS